MVSEIAIGQAEHEPLAQGIKLLRGSSLRNACSSRAATCVGIRGHRDIHGSGESGVGGVGEIDMEFVEVQ